VELASPGPARTGFQAQTRQKFALYTLHPAVRETAALMDRGFGCRELARLASSMTSAPYFTLAEGEEVSELAGLLPGRDKSFNLDRLFGYSKLVREFYWDHRMGRFLRGSLPAYQQAVRRPLPADLPPGAKIVISPLAPVERIEFTRRSPRAVTWVVLGPPPEQ